MYQSFTGDQIVPARLLWKDTPADKRHDVDHLLAVIDWDLNLDPDFVLHRFMPPEPVRPHDQMRSDGYLENWVCYRSAAFSAKELTVLPGAVVVIRDAAAHGVIMMQGHGKLGVWDVESPALIRFGQLTYDEFFVTAAAARQGVRIVNLSKADPLVMLKHFGPRNPDLII
jgi:hypothetical protein